MKRFFADLGIGVLLLVLSGVCYIVTNVPTEKEFQWLTIQIVKSGSVVESELQDYAAKASKKWFLDFGERKVVKSCITAPLDYMVTNVESTESEGYGKGSLSDFNEAIVDGAGFEGTWPALRYSVRLSDVRATGRQHTVTFQLDWCNRLSNVSIAY